MLYELYALSTALLTVPFFLFLSSLFFLYLWLFTGTTVASRGRCQVLVLDEADRMIDLGFEEEIRNTLDHYRGRVAAAMTTMTTMTTDLATKQEAPAVLGLVYGKWMLPCYSPKITSK